MLFKKAAVFTDIHFGYKSNSPVHNQDCIDFISWASSYAKIQGCDTAIFLGDMTHQRNAINLLTLNRVIEGVTMLSKSFDNVYIIPGNHDNYFKDSRDAISISWADQFPNVTVFNEITKIDNCVFAPWLVGDEHRFIFGYSGTYLFGHLEVPGFVMSGTSVMPDGNGMNVEKFGNFDKVFSGHFHKRQRMGNVHYIGNCFPNNYGDAWDDERGLMILEYGKEPEFFPWPDAPKYRTINISEMIQNPSLHLPKKGYVKLFLDSDLTFEEAGYLKDGLIEDYQLREITLVSVQEELGSTPTGNIQLQSVDEIIIDQIKSIDSEFYDTQMLLSLYRELNR